MTPIFRLKISRESITFYFISFALILALWFLIFWRTGLLTSGFRYLINDHLMITMAHDLGQKGFLSTVRDWIVFDHSIGRFQPFYYIQAITITQLFGINPTFWLSYVCLLAGLSSFFLFSFARLYGMPTLVAVIFVGIIFIGPQATMWALPSNPQVIGMTFLSATLLLAALNAESRKQRIVLDITFILLTALASLSKESFILFIPALLVIKVLLESEHKQITLYQAIMQNKSVIALLLSLMGVELAFILSSVGTDRMGYAGVDQNTFDFEKILSTIGTITKVTHLEVVAILAILLVVTIVWRKESFLNISRKLAPTLVISLLIVIPQILLYTKSGIDGIYLIPATVGVALLTCQILTLLQSQAKFVGYFLSALLFVIVLTGLPAVLSTYSQTAIDSKNMNNLFQQAQACTPNNDPILVAVNPRVRYEATLAVKRALNYVYQRNNLILATYGLEKTDFFSDRLQLVEASMSFLNPQGPLEWYDNRSITHFSEKDRISAVIVFDHLDEDFLKSSDNWFIPSNYKHTDFPISFAPARLYCKR